jgi:DNA-binding transcriptional MerR regulator
LIQNIEKHLTLTLREVLALSSRRQTMAQWYIKELSKLTNVTVRSLHHYDKIGLLKPSVRLPNSYRLYSDADLLKLELIQALKFFGFSLSKIAELMEKSGDPLDHLYAQKKFLQTQLSQLSDADHILDSVIDKLEKGSIQLEEIIKLIEGFHMPKVTYYTPDSDIQKQYEQELLREGNMTPEQLAEGHQKMKHWGKEGWEKIRKECEQVTLDLAQALQQNLSPASLEVQELIRRHYKWMCNFGVPPKEKYLAIGQQYVDHPGFKAHYDAFHPGLGAFVLEGMKIFSARELS